jgi:hypothetical protein
MHTGRSSGLSAADNSENSGQVFASCFVVYVLPSEYNPQCLPAVVIYRSGGC